MIEEGGKISCFSIVTVATDALFAFCFFSQQGISTCMLGFRAVIGEGTGIVRGAT